MANDKKFNLEQHRKELGDALNRAERAKTNLEKEFTRTRLLIEKRDHLQLYYTLYEKETGGTTPFLKWNYLPQK